MRGRERREGMREKGRDEKGREGQGRGARGRERTTLRTLCRKFLATPLKQLILSLLCFLIVSLNSPSHDSVLVYVQNIKVFVGYLHMIKLKVNVYRHLLYRCLRESNSALWNLGRGRQRQLIVAVIFVI